MKKLIALLSVLIVLGLFVEVAKAQENANPLWLMGEEVVKPAMVEQYFELCMELADLCKEENFPFSYYVWVSQPFHYGIAYPIADMNDLIKIEKAWGSIIEKFGEEKYMKFRECIESQNEKVMVGLMDLSYLPESSGESSEEMNYCYWQEISVIKGHEEDFEKLLKRGGEIMKESGSEMGTYIGKGMTGYERPVYFAWYYARDQMDFLEQEEKFAETVGDAWKEINGEIVKHIRGIKNVDYWFIKDLSYEKSE